MKYLGYEDLDEYYDEEEEEEEIEEEGAHEEDGEEEVVTRKQFREVTSSKAPTAPPRVRAPPGEQEGTAQIGGSLDDASDEELGKKIKASSGCLHPRVRLELKVPPVHLLTWCHRLSICITTLRELQMVWMIFCNTYGRRGWMC